MKMTGWLWGIIHPRRRGMHIVLASFGMIQEDQRGNYTLTELGEKRLAELEAGGA